MGTVLALEGHRAPVFRWSPAQDSEDAEGRDELVFALQGQQKFVAGKCEFEQKLCHV